MHDGRFGDCCTDLRDAMESPPSSFFRVEENGVFYVTIGYVMTEKGPGWFDQAVLFCPFCGKQLQTVAEVRARSGHQLS